MAARLTNFTHPFDKPRNGFERIDVYGAFYAKEYIDTYYDFEEKGIKYDSEPKTYNTVVPCKNQNYYFFSSNNTRWHFHNIQMGFLFEIKHWYTQKYSNKLSMKALAV